VAENALCRLSCRVLLDLIAALIADCRLVPHADASGAPWFLTPLSHASCLFESEGLLLLTFASFSDCILQLHSVI